MPAHHQAILGVSSTAENASMTVYPSIAATGLGRALGRLYDSIPLKINGIKLSHLLFTLPTAPIAIVLYLWLKISGHRYELTNRTLRTCKSLGNRLVAQASLTEIGRIVVERRAGQAFFRAGDLVVLDEGGTTLMRLDGIPRPEVFRQIIMEARAARIQTEAALVVIRARQPA